ncbi:hypothetical protein CEUSTIGMA_g11428.t1 [Chlamydomonas eustigma]|uniref:DUF4200 domain-containing protein n=1 Tax=Chlamydomonas eustigma TaxID=1157962 RepID=A0A250XLU2_9CHLO|nr:hypothetical protein CEUSTIGMA_g11428.t1 [Chlamydomonas eustigma]|eukprot:GAX84003.1 hypothetical protein CEUSTIGMA_g11428.t1 [Chlamydomonas eustigma]
MDENASARPKSDVNPFKVPGDEEIFRHREEEKAKKEATRTMLLSAPVADKSTFASRMQTTTTEEVRDLLQTFKTDLRGTKNGPSIASTTAAPERRKEKENMADFISKKREIFLLQMSLDTKRAEIKKLDERARQREEALKKSEQMLEEDALRFDAFLKENDEKVQEAIKRAEMEAKAKQDKVLEIKRLNTSTAALRSEMNKYEEQLEDCRKYKEFMDSITPAEFFEAQASKLQRRKDAMLAEWQAECERVQQRKEGAHAARVKAEAEYANARTQQEAERAERALKDAIANLKEAVKEKEPPAPNLDFESNPDEEELYFKEPQQLLAVYQELEESNLFYIQNAQETEEALEELRAKLRDTKVRMDAEVENLNLQVAELKTAIEAAKGKSQRLKDRTIEDVGALTLSMGGTAGSGSASAAISLDQLTAKVAEVYVRGGFDADASVGTLQMLTNIESKLEEYLAAVDTMPAEFVDSIEKAREKERRRIARDEKLSQQQLEHESRMQRALERASAPVFKRAGKPVMARSQPLKKKEVILEDNRNDDEAELEAYLARDML